MVKFTGQWHTSRLTVAYFLYRLVQVFAVLRDLIIWIFSKVWSSSGRHLGVTVAVAHFVKLYFLQFVFAVLHSLHKSVYFLQFVFAELRSLQFTEDWTVAVALKSATSDGATD